MERTVPYVRKNFFAGEDFRDVWVAQERAERWCRNEAGLRIHGTTQMRPLEVFNLEEAPRLLPVPLSPYQLPLYATAKVHRDHHIEVDRALYSIPGNLIGREVKVRADALLIKVFYRGQLFKVHPRKPPGGRSTDPNDLPSERTAYALRDIDYLQRLAAGHGDWVGRYAMALLDTPLPWTRMRQVYRLLGLVRRYGADAVDAACQRALEVEAVNVSLIGRILERAAEHGTPISSHGRVLAARFARDESEFAVGASAR